MIPIIKKITSTKKLNNYSNYGLLFNDNFLRQDLGVDWNEVGVANYIVNNGLSVNRVGNGLDAYIENVSNISTLEKYNLSCRYYVDTIDSLSSGIAIGQQGSFVSKSHIVGIRTDSNNLGKIFIYKDNDFNNPIYQSSNSLTINSGDILEIEIDYFITDFKVIAKNITLSQEISHTIQNVTVYPTTELPRSAKTGLYSIYVTGGESNIDWIKCSSKEVKNADYCVVGDSITERYASTSTENSYQGRLQSVLGGEWVTFAGGGNKTTEILDSIYQIIRLNPLKVILFISTNDFTNGRSLLDIQNDYVSIVNQLESSGITVVLCENIPRTGQNFNTWNTWLSSNFTNTLIQWHDVMGNPQGSTNINTSLYQDTVHPNNLGFEEMYNIALTTLQN